MKMPEQTLAPGVTLRPYEDPVAMAQDLAGRVADQLRQALAERGSALLVVSGGRTPVGFFQALAGLELAWSRVVIVPSDERWVAADSDLRNSRLIRQHLLQGQAARAQLVELVEPGDESPEQAAGHASERMDTLNWPADVVVLGMGEDGHTASLFPDAPELARALSASASPVTVTTPASQATVRLTLSARLLAGAAMTVLLVQGPEKQSALAEAVSLPLAIGPMPIRYFFQRPLQVFWSP